MAEPQRASSLPEPPARPRPARPPFRSAAPPRPPFDETQDLGPPARVSQPADPLPPAEPETAWSTWGRRSGRVWHLAFPSRSPGEWALLAVLLFGLALNASSVLANAALSPADRLLGTVVFVVGVALLVLTEIGRRNGTTSR